MHATMIIKDKSNLIRIIHSSFKSSSLIKHIFYCSLSFFVFLTRERAVRPPGFCSGFGGIPISTAIMKCSSLFMVNISPLICGVRKIQVRLTGGMTRSLNWTSHHSFFTLGLISKNYPVREPLFHANKNDIALSSSFFKRNRFF